MGIKRNGFTIVELLIVVVVIAILAAISSVAYQGIQQRASNAIRTAAAEEWVKIIKLYLATNQSYPTDPQIFCIGESNITDFDANPDVDCGVSNNIKHASSSLTPGFNTQIKSLSSSLPAFPGKPVPMTATTNGSGILFRAYDTYDPAGENVPSYPTLIYFLEGANQDCILRPLATNYGGGNFLQTNAKNSGSDIGTACRVILPDPRDL